MTAPQAATLNAIILQLTTELEEYEQRLEMLLMNWPDFEAYQSVSKGIDALRIQSAAVPELSVEYVRLLIAHAELIHCLWRRTSEVGCPDDRMEAVREAHRRAVSKVRQKCLHALAGSTEGRAGNLPRGD